jgi:16S rRNA (cytosine1402-N4)-methyltransferase
VSARHEPVLLTEVLGFLRNGPGLYLDATLGDAGHAEALLEAEPGARLLGCDRDPAALEYAERRLGRFGTRVRLAHATFRELAAVLTAAGGEGLAGALFDLGLSSRQIDDPTRGMSFMQDGPLDLRMDPSRGRTGAERLQRVEEAELGAVLLRHGEVPGARRLARALVAEARRGGLGTTRALREAVDRALGGPPWPRRYAQVFQALRIWVNDEAEDLETALRWLPGAMRAGGVVVTLAYHSGEDRRIKQALRGPGAPRFARRLPEHPGARPPERPWEEFQRRVVTPSPAETARNPRARSARLRAFRRTEG